MNSAYRFGNVVVLRDRRKVLVDTRPAALGDRAFDLLLHLIDHRDRVVGKEELLDSVWAGAAVEEGNLHVHVSALRSRLGADAITTVRGQGYRFTATLANNLDSQSSSTDRLVEVDPCKEQTSHPTRPPLVGREELLQELTSVLAEQKLVTLTGPGGVGKTRLARAAADNQLGRWRDGVWWIDLAVVSDAARLPMVVAQALALSVSGDTPLAVLASQLRSMQALLVLDNCEHLMDAAGSLIEVLLRAPGLALLTTSRERLDLPAEHVFELPPLALPAAGDTAAPGSFGAVTLFAMRAREAEPGWALTPATAACVVDICRQLDGLPLAIELAASRLPLLGLRGVYDSLSDCLRALSDGSRHAIPRHKTLRAALDWSHSLLSQSEQATYRRLSAFSGSFSLDLATKVCAEPSEDRWMFVERFDALLRKCLISRDLHLPMRWRLSQTTHLHALEKLKQHGEEGAIRRAHARAMAHTLRVIEDARFSSAEPQAELDNATAAEIDNMCSALDWACSPNGDRLLAADLLGNAARALFLHGRSHQAQAWVNVLVPMPPGLTNEQEALLHTAWAYHPPKSLLRVENRIESLRRAVVLFEKVKDPKRRAQTCCLLAQELVRSGAGVEAVQVLVSAAQTEHPGDPPRLRAWRLHVQAELSMEFGHGSVESHDLQETLVDLEAVGDGESRLAYLLRIDLALVHLVRRDYPSAREGLRRIHEEGKSQQRGSMAIGCPYGYLALAEIALGLLDEARDSLNLALDAARRANTAHELVNTLAWYLTSRGRYRSAIELLGAGQARQTLQGDAVSQFDAVSRAAALSLASTACSPYDIQRWIDSGSAWSEVDLRQALEEKNRRYAP